MSERYDHEAEGTRIIYEDVKWEMEPSEKLALFAEAQAHATLALVEQQRIANMIAVMANALVGVGAGEHSTAEYVRLHQRINPQILTALGLTAEQEGDKSD